MKYNIKVFVSFLIVVAVALLIYFNDNKFSHSLACEELEEFKEENIKGFVERKYFDESNHNCKTIKLSNQTIVLGVDTSNFFSYLNTGDEVVKRRGTDTVVVSRTGGQKAFKLYFGCSVNRIL
ncbi:hypothetical protein BDE36_3576 [Arcticibacter tournemirensis]|uniref:Uncharacterized protein n=1 Tax=Arcticibacter tournemirensis TaxID=699437 RepID=A0A4Q0M4E5_9SPHI|nr:hypothetical protein [Arcticibacter tournemirensis]KAA8484051.1 hypothetical protein F1649_06815 [Arcticibacter tournemirensis]RXF67764.1 hypothetical protein EKH83_18240 [Arcticibacter tournemirensis]TQM51784.1 hypothetical protein BDE36_3576 [Arcticibacter tournemirensis]